MPKLMSTALISLCTLSLGLIGCANGQDMGSDPEPMMPVEKPMQMRHESAPVEKLGTQSEGLGLSAGAMLPEFKAMTSKGDDFNVAEELKQHSLMFVFYRGGWCPFCNYQVGDLAANETEFASRGVMPVLISVDSPEMMKMSAAGLEVYYPMLSDPDQNIQRAFNIIHETTQEERDMLASYNIDLNAFSGRTHGNFATPSIFLVDQTGKIRFAHVDADYTTRPSAAQMLGVIDGLGMSMAK